MKKVLILLIDLFLSITIFATEVDSVTYVSDDLFYDVVSSTANLSGNVEILTNGSVIKSDTISLNLKSNLIKSKGDSYIKKDTDFLVGNNIFFNHKKEWGLFNQGSGKMEKGYFYGKTIRQIQKNTFDIDHGMFTTCDNPNHHFDIYSTKMRIYKGDMVVMKPVIILINHFPVFALPSYSFSIARGKKTGFLMPKPGRNSNDGKFIENLGYYIYYKDYWDAILRTNVREKTGFDGSFNMKYKKRYYYDGSLDILQKRTSSESGTSIKYEGSYHYKHKQNLENNAKFDVNLNYVTSKKLLEDANDINDRLSDEITSNISYTKPFLSSSFLAKAKYTDDLKSKIKKITLPNISFALNARPIYEIFLDVAPKDDPLWGNFSYQYNFKLDQSGDIKEKGAGFDDVLYKSTKDTIKGNFLNFHKAGVKNFLKLTYGRQFFGFLQYNFGAPFSFAYSSPEVNYDPFKESYLYSYNTNFNFDIIGYKNFGEFFFKGIRHTINLKTNYEYKPEIENKASGTYALGKQTESKISKFTIANSWDIKLNPPGKKNKQLLNSFLKANSAYTIYNNDKEKENKWDNIIWNGKLNGNQIIPISGLVNKALDFVHLPWFSYSVSNPNTAGATQNPYNWEIIKWNIKVPVVNSIGFKFSKNYKIRYFNYAPSKPNMFQLNKFFNNGPPPKKKNFIFQENSFSTNISWRHTFDYKEEELEDGTKLKSQETDYTWDMTMGSKIHLSKTWHLEYSNKINLKEKELIEQTIQAVKNLHCWDFTFSYIKKGAYWEYNFKFFNVKLPSELYYDDDEDINDTN